MTRTATVRSFYNGMYLSLGHSVVTGGFATTRWSLAVRQQLADTYGEHWELEISATAGASTAIMGEYKQLPGSGRAQWRARDYHPTVVTIQIAENHFTGGHKRVTGYYANDAEALTAFQTDMPEIIAALVSLGVTPANILILGELPWYVAAEDIRCYNGNGKTAWYAWNGLEESGSDLIESATPGYIEAVAIAGGCTYVPMWDCYDPGVGKYDPSTTSTHTISTTNSHPNNTGHAAIATRVNSYLPDLTSVLGRPAS